MLLQVATLVAQEPESSGQPEPVRTHRGRRAFPTGPDEASPNYVPQQYQNPLQNAGAPNAISAQQRPVQMPAGPAFVQPNVAQPNVAQPNQVLPQAQPNTPIANPQVQPAPQLAMLPAVPPQVTYRDGQLSVHALNSTLGSVLNAIRNKTGIQFEGLDAAPERIVVSMGPASAGEVLAAILTGSRYDYIAVDRTDSPGIVQRVVLTPRAGGASVVQPLAFGQPVHNPATEEEEAADDEPQDTPARPPIMQAQPIPPQPIPPQANQQPQNDVTVKTPEQLIQEMQQIKQRQEQMQQQTAPIKTPQ